jgi:pyruvate/2-oxoglutarate/acetoin dehydrogenase E1 component
MGKHGPPGLPRRGAYPWRQHQRGRYDVALSQIVDIMAECRYRTTANYSNPLSFEQPNCFYVKIKLHRTNQHLFYLRYPSTAISWK